MKVIKNIFSQVLNLCSMSKAWIMVTDKQAKQTRKTNKIFIIPCLCEFEFVQVHFGLPFCFEKIQSK